MAARRSVSQPDREKSPSDAPAPRKLKVRTVQPVSAASRSANSGKVWPDVAEPPGPAGNPWHSTRPRVPGPPGAAGLGVAGPDADGPGW